MEFENTASLHNYKTAFGSSVRSAVSVFPFSLEMGHILASQRQLWLKLVKAI